MIREHLEAIYQQHGRLTPTLVVETARPEEHPLHDIVFDCDEHEASERYYRERAHHLIRTVKVVYRDPDTDEEKRVRAFHAVPATSGADLFVYEPAAKVRQDPFLRELVLRAMEREWKALRERYEHFEEFVNLIVTYAAEAGTE